MKGTIQEINPVGDLVGTEVEFEITKRCVINIGNFEYIICSNGKIELIKEFTTGQGA